MPIGYAEVRVNITSFVVDGIDSDDLPDDKPLTAQLTLTPMIQAGKTLKFNDNGQNRLKAVAPIGPIDIGPTGDISNQGRDYVKVVAPTAVETNLAQLQWKAEFRDIRLGGVLAPVKIDPIYFWVNPGDEINLADHVNVAASTAIVLSQGQRGYGIVGFASVDGDFVVQYESADGIVEQTVEIPSPVVSAEWDDIEAKPAVIAAGSTTAAARSAISAASTVEASWSGLPGKPTVVAAGSSTAARSAIGAASTADASWSGLPDKPAVVAAGSTQAAARSAIGALSATDANSTYARSVNGVPVDPATGDVAVSAGGVAVENAVSDGVYSWHTGPSSIYNPLRDRVYTGVVSEDGTIGIAVHDRRRKISTKVNLGKFSPDDHNRPSFRADDDKPPISFVDQHAVEAFIRQRVGASPHDFASLETAAETQIAFPDVVTYSHNMRKTATNTLLLACRVGDQGWYKRVTTDWGTTWGTAYPFHTSAYATFAQYGHYAHYVTYSHPITTPNNTIRYFKINLDDGACTNAAGTVIGNAFTDTVAIANSGMTMARQSYDTDAGHNTDRVFDVGPTGSIAAMQFDKNHPESGGMYGVYRFATTGATPNSSQSPDDPQRGWVFEQIVLSGVPVGYYQSSYVGGMFFGATDNEIFLSREAGGTWTLERWTKTGATWAIAEVIATRTGGVKLGRPQIPVGAVGKGFLAAVEYFYYPTNTFLGYYGDQKLFATSSIAPPPDTTPPTVPGNRTAVAGDGQITLGWDAASDNKAVEFYRVYQGFSLIDTLTGTSKTVTGLANGNSTYVFRIKSVDTSGNESEFGTFPAATPVGPSQDPMLNSGSMVLLDPTNEFGSWPAGVPTGTVTNLARTQAVAIAGAGAASDWDFTVTNNLTATDGVVERTTKGGLHFIISQSTGVAGRKFTLSCEALRAWMAAHVNDDFFVSMWGATTRLSAETTPSTLQRAVGFLTSASGDSQSVRLATGNKMTVAPSANRLGVKESATPAVLETPININGAHSVITAPGSSPEYVFAGHYNSTTLNKGASWILYRLTLENLTVSGRTYADAAAQDLSLFNAKTGSGGRYNGDSHTAVSTLP
jgi:hypothetical protein